MLTPEQITAGHKANVDAMIDVTLRSFQGFEKLVELNLAAARSTLEDSGEQARALLSAKDAQELLTTQASLVQPAVEKTAAYLKGLYELGREASAEVTKEAEAKFADAQKKFAASIEEAMKSAPAGSESTMALVKSALAASTNAYETVQKAAKQAANAAEANLDAINAQVTKASKDAVAQVKRSTTAKRG